MCNKKAKKVKDSFDAESLDSFPVDCHLSVCIFIKALPDCIIVVLRKDMTVVIVSWIIVCLPFMVMTTALKKEGRKKEIYDAQDRGFTG